MWEMSQIARDWSYRRLYRRVRLLLDGHTLVDSADGVYLIEAYHEVRYYFPVKDVNMQYLVPNGVVQDDGPRGRSHWYDVRVGERLVKNGAWTYPERADDRPDLRDYISISKTAVDRMFEEDEEVMVLPRNPMNRIEVFKSSRHVKVVKDGVVLAESEALFLVSEMYNPTRFYFPREYVRMDLLIPVETKTPCPYKGGWSSYFAVQVNDKVYDNLAWSYEEPTQPEALRIAGCIAFHNEATDIYVDGELFEKPEKELIPPSHLAEMGVDPALRYGRESARQCGP